MTLDEVAAIVSAHVPALAGLELAPLGEGSDHAAYVVGGHVLRFPKHAEGADALAVEARLTAWLGPRLPLPVPAYTLTAGPFAAYALLPGEPGLTALPDPSLHRALGRRLGEFLRALHDQDVSRAEALGVPHDDDPGLGEWSAAAADDLRFAAASGLVEPSEWAAIVDAPPPPAPGPPRVLHGDFAGEHVLLAPDGRATAVIDWSDACLGDPARDLAGLLHWGGQTLLEHAIETYGPVDRETLARARWFALCRALGDLAFGVQRSRPEYLAGGAQALRWFRCEPT